MAAHLPYGAILLLALRRSFPFDPRAIVAAAVVLRLVCVAGEPVFSDDVYRYGWDGKVALDGIDPYLHTPDDPALAHLRDHDWKRINNPEMRTPYPPMAQGLFFAVSAISPAPGAFKLAAAAFDTLVVILILLIAAGASSKTRPEFLRAGILPALAYGLNPLACVESGMSGHVESAALAAALLAVYLVGADRMNRTVSTAAAALALAASVATKLVPVLVLPAIARRRLWILLAVPAIVVLSFLPFVASSGSNSLSSGDAMLRRWEGNGSLFPAARETAQAIIGLASGVDRPEEIIHLSCLDSAAATLQDTFFSLHKDGDWDPSRPGAFTLGDLSLVVAKIFCGVALLSMIIFTAIRKFEPDRASLWIFGAMTLLTPVLHPWYALWVLAFASIRKSWPWLALSATLPLSYLPLDGWWERGDWAPAGWIIPVEYGAPLVVLLVNLLLSKDKKVLLRKNR